MLLKDTYPLVIIQHKDKLQVINLKSHNVMQLFIEYLLFGGLHGVRQDRQGGQ